MLSQFSVKRPYTVLVAVVLVLVLGVVAFTGMRTDLLPDIELPYIVVITTYPGASPEQVEQTVTRPLESVLGAAGGLKNISSISSENSSIIILEFVQETNMDSATIELSHSIDLISTRLDSTVSKPMLMRISPDMLPVAVTTVDLEGRELDELSEFVSGTLLPAFERIDGVASVSAAGLLEKELQITLDQKKIDQLNQEVMEELEANLDRTEAQLKEAQGELSAALQKLDEETVQQQEQLAGAGVELNSAIAGLNALLAEETLLEAQRAAFEEEKKMLLQFDGMGKLPFSLPGDIGGLDPVIYEGLRAWLEPFLPEELTGLSQAEMAEMMEMAATAEARLVAVEAELQNITVRLMTAQAMKPQLESALAEATGGYRQVESGKMILPVELSKARAQLVKGQEELEKGLAELEEAQEEARGRADLNKLITAEMVSNILQAQNFTMPAGYLQEGEEGHLVKIVGRFDTEESIKNTLLLSHDSLGDIRLSDIARTALVNNAGHTYAKVNGNDGVILIFQKQNTASTTEVTGKIRDLSAGLSAQNEGLHIRTLMDQGDYINMSVHSVIQNLLIGGALAILVLFLFLMDARPTLVIALSIPLSLLAAVTLMYFTGVSLNIISLSGLALGVGMLVDNSIVVMENIYRLRGGGAAVHRAAVLGARQVGGAIFASTLTTICVFLPIVFTQGLSRQLFTDMGLTIAFSLLASLAVALTLVPTMASTVLISRPAKPQRWFDLLVRAYRRLLELSLKHKAPVMVAVLFLFGLSIYGSTVMGTAFLPEMDSHQMSATLAIPEGSDGEEATAMNDLVMARILEIDAVESVGAFAGSSGPAMMAGEHGGAGGSARAESTSFFIMLKEKRSMTNREVERLIYEKVEDLDTEITVSASTMDLSVLGGSGIEVLIKGDDLDLLAATAEEVGELIGETEGTRDILTGSEGGSTETRITINRDAAMREGLTAAQIYQDVAGRLAGKVESTTLHAAGGDEYPVIVIGAQQESLTREELGELSLTVADPEGEEKKVLLGDIAQISEAATPAAIARENQSRQVSVTASLDEGYNIGLVSRELEKKLADYTPPAGFTVEIAGENEMITSALNDITLMIILAVIFIYLIMVAQFQSLLSPLIILFTLPLAFTGGLLLLWVSGLALSVTAMLGFLVLAGIVVNNGIVYVDYVNQLRQGGMGKREALLEAGSIRLRPIVMTALTTILAMSTIALGMGSGAEMTQPMAVVAIGGLTYATLLTLLVVPVMYDFLHRRPLRKIEIEE